MILAEQKQVDSVEEGNQLFINAKQTIQRQTYQKL